MKELKDLITPVIDPSILDTNIDGPEVVPGPAAVSGKDARDPGELVFDYYDRVVGTPVKRPYYEVCLYKTAGGQIILRRYINGGAPDEIVDEHAVSDEVLDGAMELVKKYRMDHWNSMNDASCLDGRMCVCRFMSGGKMERVSTDHFPDKYYKAFGEVKAYLDRY